MNKLEQFFWSLDNRTYHDFAYGCWRIGEAYRDWKLIIFRGSKIARSYFWDELNGE